MKGPTRASLLTWRRALAMAITEQLEARVLESWHHLDAWRSLEQAGIPGKDIRHALDRDPIETQAGLAVQGWAAHGERGPLVLCDAKDSGKTFAAVRWALARHGQGLTTMWVSGGRLSKLDIDDRAKIMRKAHEADALVFDDLGAGTTTHEGRHNAHGGYFRKQVEGLLHDRAMRPTLITSNMNKLETEAYLGPKITSRMTEGPGGVVRIEHEEKLRAFDDEDADAKTGHGDRWRRARRLVEVIGCERVERWFWADDRINGEYRYTFDVGRSLEQAARWDTKQLRAVTKEHGLDGEEIRSRAVVLANEIDADEQIGRLQRQAIAMKLARIAETKRAADECHGTIAKMRGRPHRPPDTSTVRLDDAKPHPAFSGLEGVAKMKRIGFSIRLQWDGVAVYQGEGKAATVKLTGFANEADAWDGCARLLGLGW